MKYIIVQPMYPNYDIPLAPPQAIIFGEGLCHKDVARIHLNEFSKDYGRNILKSAGFCSLDKNFNVTAWGESESLCRKSNVGDEDIIYRSLFAGQT